MRQNLLFLLCFSFLTLHSVAQDIIETKMGAKIEAKVIDMSGEEIKYKKYSDIMGAMQSVNKQDVSVITFANGTVKRFVPLPKAIDKMDEPEKFKVHNADKSVLWEYQFELENVFNGKTIYYYGLDMSPLVLVSSEKESQDHTMKHYLPLWYKEFETIVSADLVKRGLRTTNVHDATQKTKHSFELMQENWIQGNWEGLNIKAVIELVAAFSPTLSEQDGVGFMLVLDTFHHPTNKARAVGVFFDIGSGAILWASKVEGDAADRDLVKHWGYGMVKMYHQFRLAVYEPEYKKYIKDKYK